MDHFSQAGPAFIDNINDTSFADIALALFRYQYAGNELYRQYTDALRINPETVQTVAQIPFLPISFFKTHAVRTGSWTEPAFVFESSGTTGETPSRHHVKDAGLYEAALLKGFRQFYGDPVRYAILALLPSYLERSNASLVQMARVLMERSGHPDNGFYLHEWDALAGVLRQLAGAGQPALLLGVTFALLDMAAVYPMALGDTVVMETGGMKGRREEWTREQVHEYLKGQWGLSAVHSEYGMTELLSQAYAPSAGLFRPAATMRVLVRDINDPLTVTERGSGCLNVVDLANVHSCAFIATEDIGQVRRDGAFEVLGRVDHSALRGCSLMAV